jgi:hypothetical protein
MPNSSLVRTVRIDPDPGGRPGRRPARGRAARNAAALALACLVGGLALVALAGGAGSATAASPSPPAPAEAAGTPGTPKPTRKPRARKPIGVACRQDEPRRSRECPVWIDYDVILTYEGTEQTSLTVSAADRRPLSEVTRKLGWRARSTEPVRVTRPLRRGGDFVLRFVVTGKYTSSDERAGHGYCGEETATTRSSGAFDGEVFVGGHLHVARKARDTVVYGLGGHATGSRAVLYRGEVFPVGTYGCKKHPVSQDVTIPNATDSTLVFSPRGQRPGRHTTSGIRYGDRVIASGPVRGSVAWSEPSTPGGIASGEVEWTWTWTLICKETARGPC